MKTVIWMKYVYPGTSTDVPVPLNVELDIRTTGNHCPVHLVKSIQVPVVAHKRG
jgi:hypothetical protein